MEQPPDPDTTPPDPEPQPEVTTPASSNGHVLEPVAEEPPAEAEPETIEEDPVEVEEDPVEVEEDPGEVEEDPGEVEEEPVEAEEAPDVVGALAELRTLIEDQQRRIGELLAVNRRQSDQFDELHRENQLLRQGQIAEALAPLVRGIARISDDIARLRAGRDDDDGLDFLDRRVADTLEDAGVQFIRPMVGEPFDPAEHAGIRLEAQSPEQDRLIAEVRRPGLKSGSRVLRPADVAVYRYTAPAPVPEPETEPEPEGASS